MRTHLLPVVVCLLLSTTLSFEGAETEGAQNTQQSEPQQRNYFLATKDSKKDPTDDEKFHRGDIIEFKQKDDRRRWAARIVALQDYPVGSKEERRPGQKAGVMVIAYNWTELKGELNRMHANPQQFVLSVENAAKNRFLIGIHWDQLWDSSKCTFRKLTNMNREDQGIMKHLNKLEKEEMEEELTTLNQNLKNSNLHKQIQQLEEQSGTWKDKSAWEINFTLRKAADDETKLIHPDFALAIYRNLQEEMIEVEEQKQALKQEQLSQESRQIKMNELKVSLEAKEAELTRMKVQLDAKETELTQTKTKLDAKASQDGSIEKESLEKERRQHKMWLTIVVASGAGLLVLSWMIMLILSCKSSYEEDVEDGQVRERPSANEIHTIHRHRTEYRRRTQSSTAKKCTAEQTILEGVEVVGDDDIRLDIEALTVSNETLPSVATDGYV